MNEIDSKIIEDVLVKTTPLKRYANIESWYEDFKRQIRKEIKSEKRKLPTPNDKTESSE